MRNTTKRSALTASLALAIFFCAGREAAAACFDFSSPVRQRIPLPKPLQKSAAGADSMGSGTKSDELYWAAIQGEVPSSIDKVVSDLVAHKSTKSDRVADIKIENVPDANSDLHQKATYTVRPFPLVTVEWTEDWVFRGLDETSQPRRVLIAYEKTSGTSHIQHLCGSIMLDRRSDQKTSVFIYQEVKATRRSEKDTLEGIKNTLQRLRSLGAQP